MLVLFSSIKPKELPHILPTTSLFIPRLYHVGIIDRSLVHFPGSSGVTLRAPYSYSDGRFMNYEPYNMLDYNISVSMNSDCPDRLTTRTNESLNSSPTVHVLIYLVHLYDSVIHPLSITQSIISSYSPHPLFPSPGCIYADRPSIVVLSELNSILFVLVQYL